MAAPRVQARGLYPEYPPWYGPALSDTSLSLGVGMSYVDGDTSAVLFPIVLTPFARGPLRLAATWGYASVRTARERVFGLGDPKIFARARLAGSDSTRLRLHLDGAARIPTAQPKLFPFASGGQELELQAVVTWRARLTAHAGAGRIWSEPGSGAGLARRDLPHATHAWGSVHCPLGAWWAEVRGDLFLQHGGGRRSHLEFGLTRAPRAALRITASFGLEVGERASRSADHFGSLRFATPLRR